MKKRYKIAAMAAVAIGLVGMVAAPAQAAQHNYNFSVCTGLRPAIYLGAQGSISLTMQHAGIGGSYTSSGTWPSNGPSSPTRVLVAPVGQNVMYGGQGVYGSAVRNLGQDCRAF